MTLRPLSRREILLGSVAAIASGRGATAGQMRADAVTVPRRVLALYDGSVSPNIRMATPHAFAAMPLEWLGLTLEYHDIREELPPIWSDPSYRGVLSWFSEPNLSDFATYVTWIGRVAASGRHVVQIGDATAKPGTPSAKQADQLRNKLYAALGLRPLGQWSDVTLGDSVSHREIASTEFECRFDAGFPSHELFVPTRPDCASWLVIKRADQNQSLSHLVVVSPAGGFIAPGYATKADPQTGIEQWFVDPFAFFAAAFGTDDLPAADTTTLCGSRIYYSHIDGDGWRSVSQVRSPGRAAPTNAEVILTSVIAPNPDLPVTVAPIAAEMDPEFAGDLRAISAARGLFRLAHVEAATHTYTHPFRWAFFKNYDPAAEAPFQDAYRSAVSGRPVVVDASDPSIPGAPGCCGRGARSGPTPPRAFGGRPFDLEQEVGGAVKLIEAIGAASNKRIRLLQWPGDCLPFPAALRAVADAGLLNINGGDTRCDREFPSVSAVAALGFRRNGLTQIYASNSSEELYTDLWTDRYFGFRDLPETWDRTEAPRRLKPFNLYYHMYSGERRASLDALLSNIAALRTRGNYIAVSASDYAAAANGFFSASFMPDGPAAWRIRDRGGLQTIRFTNANQRSLDPAACVGVLGERTVNGHLYIALDPAVAEPRVALAVRSSSVVNRPLLSHSSWTVSHLTFQDSRFSFKAQGHGPGEIVWRVIPGRQWTVRLASDASVVLSDADGMLRLNLPQVATSPTDVLVELMVT
ncbi:MAG: polysaccharide deacetylase family protein [Janthinobacterium lividum]